jgi:hypothetical protein
VHRVDRALGFLPSRPNWVPRPPPPSSVAPPQGSGGGGQQSFAGEGAGGGGAPQTDEGTDKMVK